MATTLPQITVGTNPNLHARIKFERDTLALDKGFRWSDLRLFRDYANGRHVPTLTAKQQKILRNLGFERFSDNVCHQIIFEATGRVKFVKWECTNEPIKEWLDRFYALNELEARQGSVHYNSIRDGNFVLALLRTSRI